MFIYFIKSSKVQISLYRKKANQWFLGDRSEKRYSLQSGMMKLLECSGKICGNTCTGLYICQNRSNCAL